MIMCIMIWSWGGGDRLSPDLSSVCDGLLAGGSMWEVCTSGLPAFGSMQEELQGRMVKAQSSQKRVCGVCVYVGGAYTALYY